MEISFTDLKEKEIVNVFDGKKLGRIVDILFDNSSGVVRGIVVPGEKKLFRKNEDIFVPLEKIRKIGDDVILVSLQAQMMNGVVGQVGNSYGRTNGGYMAYSSSQNFVGDAGLAVAYPESMRSRNSKNGKIVAYQTPINQASNYEYNESAGTSVKYKSQNQGQESFVRYKRIDNKKYK